MRKVACGVRGMAAGMLLLAGLAGPAGMQNAGAQTAGDAAEGRRLAERYCKTCHVLTERDQAGWTDAPPFPSIAARGGMSAARIEALLQTSQMHMLNLPRSPTEAADLAAFVMSLR